jgi:hypothetical protein
MVFNIQADAIEWRGPAPFVFVPVSLEISSEIRVLAKTLSYGWGVIPVTVLIGDTEFNTSLFPRDGIYLVPIKVAVQKAEGVNVGESVRLELRLGKFS